MIPHASRVAPAGRVVEVALPISGLGQTVDKLLEFFVDKLKNRQVGGAHVD